MEHLTTSFLDEAPFEYYLPWDFMTNPRFWFTTSSLEPFFPLLTSQYGDNIPIDIKVLVTKVWEFRSNATDRRLSFKLNMNGETYLHIPDGSRKYIGLLEFYDAEVWISIYSEGMVFKGLVEKFEFREAYTSTVYGISRYRSTPFLINISLYGMVIIVNEDYLDTNMMAVPANWGYFKMQDLHLDYYDHYIGMGITPRF